MKTLEPAAMSELSQAFALIDGTSPNERNMLSDLLTRKELHEAMLHLSQGRAFKPAGDSKNKVMSEDRVRALSARRRLKSGYSMSALMFFSLWAELAAAESPKARERWQGFARSLRTHPERGRFMKDLLREKNPRADFDTLFTNLETEDPHAIFPTSIYRDSAGDVVWSKDQQRIHAVMETSTMTDIEITEGVLEADHPLLADFYRPFTRCVCIIDENVEKHHGEKLKAYFASHQIPLECRVHRAMEVDKNIRTVEKIMADFKEMGVSRNEPVLVAGGGVLADTAGLACSLYHRNTPYVMLATSIVSGIDAGPSPRTCCDGFGYKNLFGAYHAPVLTITDRSFFKTLDPGWLRHGVAEIIKMAVVKDKHLFSLLETYPQDLLETHFGASTNSVKLKQAGQEVLGSAMRNYVEAEYGNLFETHQCRPHAFGHTWSPGFEIPAGLLHGHAVSCGMGFGAYLSYREGWLPEKSYQRTLRLIEAFGLSLYHPIMDDQTIMWESQLKMTQKRGGNLAAPIPKGDIGKCGYLNTMEKSELRKCLDAYKDHCSDFARGGLGIDPHCSDVGLEDPSVTGSAAPGNGCGM